MSVEIKLVRSTEGDWEQLRINNEVAVEGHKLDAKQVIETLMDSGLFCAASFYVDSEDPEFF